MEKETLIAEFEREYRALLADESKQIKGGISRKSQGKLYQKYKDLGLSTEDMARITIEVEGTSGETNLKSTERKINLCIQKYTKSIQTEVDDTQESITTKASDTAILIVDTNSRVEDLQNRAEDLENLTPDDFARRINSRIGRITQDFIAIGRDLKQVKPKIEHGQWEKWLQEKVHMNRQTAFKAMKCYERFGNVSLAQQLDQTKMEELLVLPESDTAAFFARCEEEGTPVQNMTKTELRNKIKQWKNPPQAQDLGESVSLYVSDLEVSSDVVTAEGTAAPVPKCVELTFWVAQEDEQHFYQVLKAAIEQDTQLSEVSRQSVLATLGTLLS